MEKLNILHLADIHFGKKNDYKLYNMLKEAINSIPDLIEEYDHLDMICIEGDLYDRIIKMNEPSARLVIDFINELLEITNKYKMYFRIIKGTKTHDYNQLNIFKSLEAEYPFFRIIDHVEDEYLTINKIKYHFLYLPEEYPEDYNEYYSEFFNQEYDQIFGHGMMEFVAFTGNNNGISLSRKESVHNEEKLMKICKGPIVFGHIHDFHNYKDKVFYVGSYERFSFADQEDKGFIITSYDKKNKSFNYDFYENTDASTYKEFNLDLLDDEEYTVEEKIKYINDLKKKYNYVKIKSSNQDNTELIKNIISNDENIKMEINNDIKDTKVDEKFLFILNREYDLTTTIQKYIEITKNKKIDKDVINKILKPE